MDSQSIAQNTELHNRAMAMVIRGQVSKNGKDGQCFVSTDDGLYVANATACTCAHQPCPHTLAAILYNDMRHRVEQFTDRRQTPPMTLFWRLRDALDTITDAETAEKIEMALVVCQHLHREERSKEINTFYSVCASGGGVMFCPVPPKRRRYP